MINKVTSTRVLYDRSATSWARRRPESLSDYTARAPLLPLLEPLAGKRVLDLGCGEGYCARILKQRGAAEVLGIDLSEGMIGQAQLAEADEPLGIRYVVGSATELAAIGDQTYDAVLAMFLYNYLTVEQMRASMREIRRVLRPAGTFIFAVPHPAFPFMRGPEPPFYFQVEGGGYYGARDRTCAGRIWKRDGTSLDVQLVHKTIEDYFDAMASAGFERMPKLHELRVTGALIDLDPGFFSPLHDLPLHLALEITT